MSRKPWTLPIEEPIGTYRELVALQIRETVRPEDSLGDVHLRFCARLRCPACGLTAVCTHRDRVGDLKLILGTEGKTSATHLPRTEAGE